MFSIGNSRGVSNQVTTHGIRAMMISMLVSAGFSDAAVVLRTRLRDTTSLQSYHNLMVRNGEEQLKAVLADINKRQLESEPSTLVCTHKSGTIPQRGEDGKNDGILGECSPSSAKRICMVGDAETRERSFEVFGRNLQATNCTSNVTVNNIERYS